MEVHINSLKNLSLGVRFKKGEHASTITEFKRGSRKLPKAYSFGSGTDNPTFKGDNAGNQAMHDWVKSNLGTPNICDICKTTKAKKYEWANKYHTYKRILEDYIRMCTSCHRNYDIKNNNY